MRLAEKQEDVIEEVAAIIPGPYLHIGGDETFVTDPEGLILARGAALEDEIVVADLDLGACRNSTARRLFWRDRRPGLYAEWLALTGPET